MMHFSENEHDGSGRRAIGGCTITLILPMSSVAERMKELNYGKVAGTGKEGGNLQK